MDFPFVRRKVRCKPGTALVLASARAAGKAAGEEAADESKERCMMCTGQFLRVMGRMAGKAASWRLVGVVVAAAVLSLSAVLSAQEVAPIEGSPQTMPATSASGDGGDVKMVQPGSFEIHVRDTDLRVVLQLLSSQGRRNIVATKDVTGKFSADLYGVTFKEALDAVMRSTGFVYEERGNFVYVYTPEQLEKIRKAERKMAVANFRLTYMTAADAKTLLAPALSAEGSMAITPAASTGIDASKSSTGGNGYASEDMLVIRDYEENVKTIGEMIREMDVKPEQVLIEVTVLKAKLTEENALGIDFNVLAGIDFESVGTPPDVTLESENRSASFRTDFNSNLPPTGGLSFGFVSNNVAMFLRALETVTPTTVLANPKLLVVNKQRGEVLVGRHEGYLTQTVTETVATYTVAFLDTGMRLVVRPFIGKNGYVRMEIHPEDSIGSTKTVANNVIPSSDTTEVTSNVMVRDGHTIVIGGLFREQTQASRSQIPLLGNIPVAGTLFRDTDDVTTREEVIMLITPRIIKQEDEATAEQVKDDVERFRIGARKSVQWWARDRLSVAYMQAARKNVTAGQIDKAQWDVDMALSLSPQMPEAIQLKERLTNKAFWSDETRVSDAKNMVERMVAEELGLPFEPIVTPEKPLDVSTIDESLRKALGIEPRPLKPLVIEGEAVEVVTEKAEAPASEVKAEPKAADEKEARSASAPAGQPVE